MMKRTPLILIMVGLSGSALAVLAAMVYFYPQKREFTVETHTEALSAGSPVSVAGNEQLIQIGVVKATEKETSCQNPDRRFVAVMLASDTVTRPLSGIGLADIVVEMPVVTGSITRLMAFYGCNDAAEIGSIRSARDDFIPLAASFDAVYAHWGGSHFALDNLRAGVIDNLDALINPSGAFWRKKGIAAPHNGFSSTERLYGAAERLGYRLEKNFQDYPRSAMLPSERTGVVQEVAVEYPGAFRVEWRYNLTTQSYRRWRGGMEEIDAVTGEQVRVKNVVVMRTVSKQIEGQYNDVKITGEGGLEVFRGGARVVGRWQKTAAPRESRLRFLDEDGSDIVFAPGKIWLEVVDQTVAVSHQPLSN